MRRGTLRSRLLPTLAAGVVALIGAGNAMADGTPGAVYTETNTTPINFVDVFSRAIDGTLTLSAHVPTGGSGVPTTPPLGFPVLDSQGGVTLSADGRRLLVVNAGSNTVSSFSVGASGIVLVDQVPSHGVLPVSLTVNHTGVLYVLNELSDSIAGFRVSPAGKLTLIPGSVRTVGSGTLPGEIDFNPTGDVLVVGARETNQLASWVVAPDGTPGPTVTNVSNGNVPFGFAFDARGRLLVTNADTPFSSASTYDVDRSTGALTPIDFEPTFTLSACWAVITNSNQFAFVSSPLDQSISSLRIDPDGTLNLLDSHAATTTGFALDEALSRDSRFLYVVNPANLGFTSSSIDIFGVKTDGSLTPAGSVGGLPGSLSGLAAT
jgi:6-phosphogluconolactonase